MSIKQITKLSQARAIYALQTHEKRRQACRARKIEAQIKWCENMAIMRQINQEIAPKLASIQEAEERLSGVKNVHSNAYGLGNRYCQLSYCGGIHSPAPVNSTGMEENETLWTTGNALAQRDSEK